MLRSQIFSRRGNSDKRREENGLSFLFDLEGPQEKENVPQMKEFEEEKSIKRMERKL